MKIKFSKYHGTGNDFILIDNIKEIFPNTNNELIKNLCDRRIGIGGDGLILLNEHYNMDFEMLYFNSDGYEGSMCGNGGRCAAMFANETGIISKNTIFKAFDGRHEATIENELVNLSMNPVTSVEYKAGLYILDTGSPHAVVFAQNNEDVNVIEEGKKIRHNKDLSKDGVNVDFVEIVDDQNINVRTYERGVENETLSCGTGVIASALATFKMLELENYSHMMKVQTKGGELSVSFTMSVDLAIASGKIRFPERYFDLLG